MSADADDQPLLARRGSPRTRDEAQLEFLGLNNRTYEANLDEIGRRNHIWYGHEDIAPHEIQIRTPANRWVLLVNVPLELSPDGSGSPMPREQTRQQAAEWRTLNRIEPWPDLPGVNLAIAWDDGSPGASPSMLKAATAAAGTPAPVLIGLDDLVTLDQCAALVNRKKRSLENYKKTMPRPKILGGGGKPHEYAYSEMRPWLEKTFGRDRPLPETYPGKPKTG